MSVDTRTPRPTGGRSPGFDEEPALSTVKVPCDPAQVIVNHASFRVQLATPDVRSAFADPARHSAAWMRTGAATRSGRRRAPVVWSGRTEPGDPAAGQLLQAVRNSGVSLGTESGGVGGDVGATQVLPRIRIDDAPPTVIGPRSPGLGQGGRRHSGDTELLRGVRPVRGAYDDRPYDDEPHGGVPYRDGPYGDRPQEGAGAEEFEDLGRFGEEGRRGRRQGTDQVRHAYYPGRRMNLGVVLLPLRIFLGFISIYAGMGKLCDPVYFDGGDRGSMVTWLASLQPWAVASPLRDFALAHPVGSGLSVAFLQVVVGVLTVFGLWQRVAASFGALLSATLLLTVSWRSVPAYDAPDIIYLAAWSPLMMAGAPVYSMDSRLAGEAWRRLGPRVRIWDLRRRVLRRGTVMATLVVGVTLLGGSMLGGAVRSSDLTTVPGPTDAPRNHLPGSPLPERPGSEHASQGPTSAGSGSPSAKSSASPSASTGTSTGPGAVQETGTVGTGQQPGLRAPSGQNGSGAQEPQRPAAPAAPPSRTAGPSSSGGSATPGGASGDGGGSGGSGGDSSSGGALGGLLG
ncbi:DoxX family protein [Streptomyces sp. NPDC004647]|uniref:DoxX family protein n=1 Tax=Streptomyces sp. NPDC004647 TaxID=3154671 RepID=UPI0033B30463